MGFIGLRGLESEKKRFVSAMLRTAIECEGNVLSEMVEAVRPFFGECQLTIMCNQEHSIIYTTQQGDDAVCNVEKMVKSIQNPDRDRTYHSYQKNYIWFRKEYPYIRTIPLTLMGQCNYTLVVEGIKGDIPSLGRESVILALAVKQHVLERESKERYYLEPKTGLPNREAFVADWKERKTFTHMGYICLKNRDALIKKHGYAYLNQLIEQMTAYLSKDLGDSMYFIGEGQLIVGMHDSDFHVVSQIQDSVDELEKGLTDAEFCGVVVSGVVDAEPHYILYECERIGAKTGTGVVVMIRSAEDMEINHRPEERFVSG